MTWFAKISHKPAKPLFDMPCPKLYDKLGREPGRANRYTTDRNDSTRPWFSKQKRGFVLNIQLIADSCCDMTPAMRHTLRLLTAPLKISVNGKEYVDDENISVKRLLADIKASKTPISSAAPAPEEYAALMRDSEASVVVTLSSHLSGSYNAAMAARSMVLEESPDKKIAVFDSKSASAGETRIILYLTELLAGGTSFESLQEKIPPFISSMRTFFVLEDLSTLIKNGRIPKMAGMLGTMLMLRPIMGENGEGEIISVEKVRGTQQALDRLVDIVAQRTAASPAGS